MSKRRIVGIKIIRHEPEGEATWLRERIDVALSCGAHFQFQTAVFNRTMPLTFDPLVVASLAWVASLACTCTKIHLIRQGDANYFAACKYRNTTIGMMLTTACRKNKSYSVYRDVDTKFTYRAEKKSLYVVWWSLFLLLLTTSASTCLQHSRNHVRGRFLSSVL